MPRSSKPFDMNQQLASINRTFEEQQAQEKAKRLGLEYCDVGNEVINPDLLSIVTEEETRKAEVMPYYRIGKRLRVAVFDPDDGDAVTLFDILRSQGYQLNISIASHSGLEDAWKQYRSGIVKPLYTPKSVISSSAMLGTAEQETSTLQELKEQIATVDSADAAITILTGAVRTGASDVHLEPFGESVRLRFRIDGVAHTIFTLTRDTAKLIIEQFKYQAHMKINISNKPQDGRFTFDASNRSIDARVSTLPTVEGETIVMRLLDNERQIIGLEGLGMRGQALKDCLHALHDPHGMILCTGPTGSGKTTTLYSMLTIINTAEKKVITLEDPVEYRVAGIIQSQINPNENYTFSSGLRSILRQDPDIVMIGEIRDLETAEIAAQAAMTGHIVLSTLHTNDAVSAVPRLRNMGLKRFIIAPSLGTIIAQRLVRRICTVCGKLQTPSVAERSTIEELLASLQTMDVEKIFPKKIMSAVGCDICSHTGYRGQIGIFEVFRLTDEMKQMVLDEKSVADLFMLARKNGMLTMREDGVLRVIEGTTTVAEIIRVTGST